MKRLELSIGAALALGIAGCASNQSGTEPEPIDAPASLSTDLRDAGGRVRARASVTEVGDSIRVRVESAGLAQGAYAAHIHTTGRCDAPGFESAGPHWNPTEQQHGKDNPAGMHKGDLPNLLVGTDGSGSFEYTVQGATIGGSGPRALLDADGAALIVHASADDYHTDPSGNSGARIACGVLG